VLGSISCNDVSQPVSPPRGDQAADGRAAAVGAAEIDAQIDALFRPPYLRIAKGYFSNIRRNLQRGNLGLARQRTVEFIAFFLVPRLKDGRLRDPNGASPPTTAAAVIQLIRDLYVFVGLEAPDIAEEVLGDQGAVGYVDERGGIVTTDNGFAGIAFPPGALDGPVLVTLQRLPDSFPPRRGPLPTELDQFPLFYRVETAPKVGEFNIPARVGICQVTEVTSEFYAPEPAHDRLRIARADPDDPTRIEIPPLANADDFLRCVDVDVLPPAVPPSLRRLGVTETSAAGRGWMLTARAVTAALEWLGPAEAHAGHGGKAASLSSLSVFAAVDPGSVPAPTAVRVCTTGVGGTTFDDFADAVNAVAAGGTVRVCAGEYAVAGLTVAKPLTIEAEGATKPVLRAANPSAPIVLSVSGVRSGTVSLRNLRFDVPTEAAISIRDPYDQVLVEGSVFAGPPTAAAGVFVGPSTVAGAHVVLRDNELRGSRVGVLAIGAPRVDVLANVLGSFALGGVEFLSGSSGRIAGNTLTSCGSAHCIAAFEHGGADVVDNVLVRDPLGRTQHGIILSARPGVPTDVANNSITGAVTGPRGDPLSYTFSVAGIRVDGRGAVSLDGNSVTNAYRGLEAGPETPITATHNSVRVTHTAVRGSAGLATENDFEDYVLPFEAVTAASLPCNWWGSAAGPQNVPAGTPASLFTPWATAPIANAAQPACDGGLDGVGASRPP
jgi:hypothetical protein